MRILNLHLLLVGLLLCSGCTAVKTRLSQNSPLPSMAKESTSQSKSQKNASQTSLPDYETPVKMLAIWKDSVRMEDNGSAMRGFGGRLYLYNEAGEAVRAQGDLVVYGFDDSVTNRQGSKADRKIVIENQQLQKHYSESALGPSYSVWISWDRVGSVDKSVTLVPFFRPQDGEIVQTGQSVYTLHTPGQKTDTLHKERISSFEQAPRAMTEPVSRVNYVEPTNDQAQARMTNSSTQTSTSSGSNLRTTTIALPRATQQRLQGSDFGMRNPGNAGETSVQSATVTAANQVSKPSRLDEARKNRKLQIKEGNVFGRPGQL